MEAQNLSFLSSRPQLLSYLNDSFLYQMCYYLAAANYESIEKVGLIAFQTYYPTGTNKAYNTR